MRLISSFAGIDQGIFFNRPFVSDFVINGYSIFKFISRSDLKCLPSGFTGLEEDQSIDQRIRPNYSSFTILFSF